jgi:hypothetical protein
MAKEPAAITREIITNQLTTSTAGFQMSRLIGRGTFASTATYLSLEGLLPPFSVCIYPGSGCTCTVKSHGLPGSGEQPPASGWEQWSQGDVSTATTSEFSSPLAALEISRVSGSATCEYAVWGIQ